MIWQDLISEINSSTFVILHESDPSREFSDAAWFPAEGCASPRQDVFYFAERGDLSALPSAGGAAILSPERPPAGGGCLLWFTDRAAFRECFRLLSDAFSREWELRRVIDRTAFALSGGQSLAAAMDILAEHFQAAVSVADSAYSILAFSTLFRPSSPMLRESDFSGQIFPEIVRLIDTVLQNRRFRRYSDVDQGAASERLEFEELFPESSPGLPFAVKDAEISLCCYLVPVLRSGYLVGLMSVMFQDGRRLSPAVLRLLPRLAAVLSPEVEQISPATAHKYSFYTQLLSRLFAGGIFDDEEIGRHISLFGYRLLPLRYIIAVRPKDGMSDEKLDSAAFSLLNLFANSVYALKDGTILYFHSRKADDPLLPETLSGWNSYLSRYSFTAGVSSHFFHFSQCAYASRQAIVSLLMGPEIRPGQAVHYFDEIRSSFQASVLCQGEDYQVLVHPEIAKLLEYDERHGTELSRLLYLYVRHPKEPEKVYKALHIHRNTLYSRLYRIQSVIDVDLDDGEFITQANISYHILKRNRRIDWPLE